MGKTDDIVCSEKAKEKTNMGGYFLIFLPNRVFMSKQFFCVRVCYNFCFECLITVRIPSCAFALGLMKLFLRRI